MEELIKVVSNSIGRINGCYDNQRDEAAKRVLDELFKYNNLERLIELRVELQQGEKSG